MSGAFYNEIDPYAAQWLRNLIREGLIADGEVCERSIVDLRPADLVGFTQCHFFAGLGGWSYALRLAGWPDDRPVWTGSCPCQPFSVAGKGSGTSDARHLWPDFFRLIRAARPPVVMGEQVAGAAGYGWLDGVRSDLEGEGYASRGVDIPACSVDAPHIRSRLYWIACEALDDAAGARRTGDAGSEPMGAARIDAWGSGLAGRGGDGREGVANANGGAVRVEPRRELGEDRAGALFDRGDCATDLEHAPGERRGEGRSEHGVRGGRPAATGAGRSDVAHAACAGRGQAGRHAPGDPPADGGWPGNRSGDAGALAGRNGTAWSDHVWLTGADGKSRRSQPGLRLLAHGLPGRVGRLRAYGNAIVPQVAAEVIAAFMEAAA